MKLMRQLLSVQTNLFDFVGATSPDVHTLRPPEKTVLGFKCTLRHSNVCECACDLIINQAHPIKIIRKYFSITCL